jgi:hypothetical protein
VLWSWVKLRGKPGLSLVIASLYRPVYSTGALSTYQQHKTLLLKDGTDECPRSNILKELGQQLQKSIEQENQVVVCGDFNDNDQGNTIKSFFQQDNMSELVIAQHGPNAPNTFMDGSLPIDGIFGTPSIEAPFSGYSSFSWRMYSDHRMVWADLELDTILGTRTTPIWKPQARRLKCKDPRFVHKFNNTRRKHM